MRGGGGGGAGHIHVIDRRPGERSKKSSTDLGHLDTWLRA